MIIQDTAIILGIRKFKDSDLIVKCLSREHGLLAGILKYAIRRNRGGEVAEGNICQIIWKARLEEHLGTYKIENHSYTYHHIAFDKLRLQIMNSAIAMSLLLLHEKEPQIIIFDKLNKLLNSLISTTDDITLLKEYVFFELELLNKSGFGLDLSKCIATGTKANLSYISPRSGCAVSLEGGKAYHDKLFPLHPFVLNQKQECSHKEIQETLGIIMHFLNTRALEPYNKLAPIARNRLLSILDVH